MFFGMDVLVGKVFLVLVMDLIVFGMDFLAVGKVFLVLVMDLIALGTDFVVWSKALK